MAPRPQDFRQHVQTVIKAVLFAADPVRLMVEAISKNPPRAMRPAMIAVGKAASAMYSGWCSARPEPQHAIMVVPDGVKAPDWALRGEHPIPGARSVQAAAAIEAFIDERKRSPDVDGFVLLLSGGASALLTSPSMGVDLVDIVEVTRSLLLAGAPIGELNRVRKHLERLKGGRMAALMTPLPVEAYLLSDVPDDDVNSLGSGPVLPDGSTFAGALQVLMSHGVVQPAIVRHLEAGASGLHPETPKHGDPAFRSVRCILIGSNADAIGAAEECLEGIGFEKIESYFRLTGEAAQRGRDFCAIVRPLSGSRSSAFVGGGETTVRVGAADGKGGRNQEFALAAAISLDGAPNALVASFATDGVDGPTDAAGAIVTGDTCRQARQIGLDPAAALVRHDSYTFFTTLEKAGFPHLIRTGPTGTNVNDVAIALVH